MAFLLLSGSGPVARRAHSKRLRDLRAGMVASLESARQLPRHTARELPGNSPACYRAAGDRLPRGRRHEVTMSVDGNTVRRIAHLARIAVAEEEVAELQTELNAMLAFVEQLSEVDVEGVEPMTSVTPMALKQREDKVTDGDIADDILRNAPATESQYFLVPKVVE
jgi:aspartyl-tRNA(Asn)/glutamyl-tRNA(Gln) amidotransferase subunit C